MILYYSRLGKTKVIAEVLSEIKSMPIYRLESDLESKSGFSLMFDILRYSMFKKPYYVNNMPTELPEEIYICTPIWDTHIAPPVRHFLQNISLENIKVHFVITPFIPNLRHLTNMEKLLKSLDCIPGQIYTLAVTKESIKDIDTLREHMKGF